MKPIKRTDHNEVLAAFAAKLIADGEGFTEDNCWLTDQAVPASMPAGRWAITISIGPGRYPHEYFSGGGQNTLVEDGSVIVSPIVAVVSDRPARAWKKIGGKEPNSGDAPTLLDLKRRILGVILKDHWEPTDDDGNPMLRDQISPISCSSPQDVRIGQTVASMMQLQFSTVFDWNLS